MSGNLAVLVGDGERVGSFRYPQGAVPLNRHDFRVPSQFWCVFGEETGPALEDSCLSVQHRTANKDGLFGDMVTKARPILLRHTGRKGELCSFQGLLKSFTFVGEDGLLNRDAYDHCCHNKPTRSHTSHRSILSSASRAYPNPTLSRHQRVC